MLKEKYLNRILDVIIEHNAGTDIFNPLSEEYIRKHTKLPKNISFDQAFGELLTLGLIEYSSGANCTARSISLTESGKSYFIDRMITQKRNRTHDWQIAIFSTAIATLLSDPLWEFLRPLCHKIISIVLTGS